MAAIEDGNLEKKMSNDVDYIDTSMLDNLSQFLNAEKLQSLLKRYIVDSTRLLEQLRESLANGNAEESRRHVHSLKSTSANIGANPLAKIAAELEEFARLEQLEAVKNRLDELLQVFESTATSIGTLEVMQQQQTG